MHWVERRCMGLFNRKKNKNRSDTPSLAKATDGADELADRLHTEQPRCRHYMFAHVALRQMAFEYPVEVIAALGSGKSSELIDDLWNSVDQACTEQGDNDQPPVNPADIKVHRMRIGEFPTAVVEMPKPIGTTEAYFTAIVLCVDPKQAGHAKDDMKVRYFTLEKGAILDTDDFDRTVLCEWTADGSHINSGGGAIPELSSFIEAITAQL